jgi:CRISPR system Cascade subunit CasC
MAEARFVQIHSLHGYSAALLNRDDSGLAKRLPYGQAMRTRVSSQCLKRHWRMADGPHALSAMPGAEEAVRSRELVTKRLRGPLEGEIAAEILDAVEGPFQIAVYGKDAAKGKSSRQPLLFGAPELGFLADRFAEIARGADDAAVAKKTAEAFAKDKEFQATMKAMRAQIAMPGGLTAALFGRMVTSDTEANIDAPVHVAHAFTVHGEESESDYFAVVDDLAGDEPGADHIGETELTSGLFYGYVVLDVPGLVSNLTGAHRRDWLSADRAMAGEVAARLLRLIAEVSPGAKRGATAPYGYAATMLVEIGDRQPRSLAEAFRTPVAAQVASAEGAMAARLAQLDDNYAGGEARRFMALRNDAAFPAAERATLPGLADWLRAAIVAGAA